MVRTHDEGEGPGSRRSLAESVEGTRPEDFGSRDWGELLLASIIFGSAFLWIALSLRSIDPATIAFGRAALGAAALIVLPRARRAVARADWGRLTLSALFGMAIPVYLFALAEERITSALAGMLVSAIPIFTSMLAAVATRSWPRPRRLLGLVIGFVGIVLLTFPNLRGASAESVGVLMVLGAVVGYAWSALLYAPLQQAYGALPVTTWLLGISAVALAPFGVLGLGRSEFEWLPVVALLILGVIGSGIAWAMWVSLIGRVGAVRTSMAGYVIPIVALALGAFVLDERVEPIQIVGVLVALAGSWLLSRGQAAAVTEG